MANAFTPNLNLTKPEVGADSNLWGGHTNGDWDIVDSIFTATSTMMVSMVLKSDTSIVDFTTTSKRMLFNLTGISTSTTRNLSVQDSDGTLAYTAQVAASTVGLGTVTTGQVAAATVGMVDTTSSQILTNKTLTAPLLTGILAASTGVTTTAGDNSTKLATTAYADRIGIQQIVTNITGAVSSGTGAMFLDDTIPQNTEGNQFMTLAITPKSATSKLLIQVVANFASTASDNVICALFQDSIANALAAAVFDTPSSGVNAFVMNYEMTSGTTSATTFKVRIGSGSGGGATITFNGSGGTRLMGGVMASSIIITEMSI